MIFFELFYPFATQMERISTLLNVRKLEFPPRFVRELPEEVPVFFTLPARSHHSKAFSIHLIIYIGHSPPITRSLQLKITNRSFWYAAPHLWNKQKLPPTLCVPYQSGVSSPSSLSSGSGSGLVVDISYDVFH